MESKPNHSNSLVVVAVLVIAIIFFIRLMFKDSKSDKQENSSIETNTTQETPIAETKVEIGNLNDGTFQEFENEILLLKSKFNDKEFKGKIVQTNLEETIHKLDFKKKMVTLETIVDGQVLSFKYPMNGFYKQKGIVSETNVIIVNSLGVKEIWFNLEIRNLGYDYDDGLRIACYEISSIR
jgi:hypothetical protein